MTDFIREIEEDIRRERLEKLWKRYGVYLIAAGVLIVALAAGWTGWQRYRSHQIAQDSVLYAAAASLAQAGKPAAAAAAFAKIAADGDGGYRVLAGLRAAGAYLAAGDRKAAIAAYDRLAQDSSVEARYRDLARYLSVLNRADSAKPKALEAELRPLLQKDDPWRFSARELMAVLELKAGDKKAAARDFGALANDLQAPVGLRERAAGMHAALTEAK